MRYFVELGPGYRRDITRGKLYPLELTYAISDNHGNICWVKDWLDDASYVVMI